MELTACGFSQEGRQQCLHQIAFVWTQRIACGRQVFLATCQKYFQQDLWFKNCFSLGCCNVTSSFAMKTGESRVISRSLCKQFISKWVSWVDTWSSSSWVWIVVDPKRFVAELFVPRTVFC